MELDYIRLSKGLTDKGKLIPYNELGNISLDHNKDYYRSVFLYNQEQYDAFQKSKTVAGITDVFTHNVIFDFDSAFNLEEARQDTIQLVTKLLEYGLKPDDFSVAYSGSKGFSVEIHTIHKFNPSQLKKLASALAKGLKTFDTKVYNASRIFRIPFTKHPATGLFKLPITVTQLSELSVEQIQDLAKDLSNGADPANAEVELPDTILKLSGNVVDEQDAVKSESGDWDEELSQDFKTLDFSACHKSMPKCKFSILNGFFKPGNRNHALMALAAHYKSHGTPKEVTHRILKGAAELQSRRFKQDAFSSDEIWNNIIRVVYSPTWKGATYSCKDHEFLKEVCPNNGQCSGKDKESVTDVMEMAQSFINFSTNLEKNLIKTGLKTLDDKLMLLTSTSVGLLGAPGSGKTSVALKLLANAREEGSSGLFFSLDMGKPIVFAKMAMNVSGLNDRALIEVFKNNPKERDRISKAVYDKYGTFPISFKSGQTVADFKDVIQAQQDKTGKKIKLVVVDYLELISGPYSDATANSAYISAQLKDLSTDMETCLITLVQPQKSAGDASVPLESMRKIKGASALEQNFRTILSVHREGFSPNNPENDRFMTVNCLKNTLGGLFSLDYRWEGSKGELYEMTPQDRVDIEYLREQKAKSKDESGSGWGD
jgi:KaiC/GvpD/RAD55 family RecA-like ATPase